MARGRSIPARTSMTIGLATMAAGHFAFAFLPANWVVLVGGLAFGVYLPLFWLPMNSLLVRETSPANRAGRLAGVTATFTTVAVVAPVLGGYLAVTVGFPFLFSLGGLILAATSFARVDSCRARSLSPTSSTCGGWARGPPSHSRDREASTDCSRWRSHWDRFSSRGIRSHSASCSRSCRLRHASRQLCLVAKRSARRAGDR